MSNKSDLWDEWKSALKTEFRFDFPLMRRDEISRYLSTEDQTVQVKGRSIIPCAAPTRRERE